MCIAILEDDKKELEELLCALKEGWSSAREIECYTKGDEVLAKIEAGANFSVVFLDIYMPGENGVEIAKKLHIISPNTEIVFTTASLDHAISAFELNALHYLIKPITKEKIEEVYLRYDAKRKKKRPIILIKVGRNHCAVFLDQIAYLQSNNHTTDIKLLDSKVISVYSKISDLEKDLGECFVKIQRGFIVNMSFIEKMDGKECVLQNGEKIMLSRKERNSIRETYENYIFKCLAEQGTCYERLPSK